MYQLTNSIQAKNAEIQKKTKLTITVAISKIGRLVRAWMLSKTLSGETERSNGGDSQVREQCLAPRRNAADNDTKYPQKIIS